MHSRTDTHIELIRQTEKGGSRRAAAGNRLARRLPRCRMMAARVLARPIAAIILGTSLLAGPAAAQSAAAELLRQQLEYGSLSGESRMNGESLHAASLMLELYAENDFALLWTRPEQLAALEQLAQRIDAEGLDPDDLPLQALRKADEEAQRSGAATALVERELLATETLIRAAYLLNFGKVNPYNLDNDWNFNRSLRPDLTPIDFFLAAIAADDLNLYLAEDMPRGPIYIATMEALAAFRKISRSGGWQPVSAGATLHEGDSDPRVMALRARLRMTGQLTAAADSGTDVFDNALVEAVIRFQDQHGLETDGAVGGRTLAALNVPVDTRINQLRMALERLRWVLDELADDMLIVNIAGFRASLVQDGQVSWDGRVMVGQPYRKTPIFRDDIEYLVFNPTWTVPPGILAKDTLPAIQRDPGYLARTNMVVLTRDGKSVDPATIDWPSMSARGFPYILRQQPGPKNAMGQVKFIFPNEHFVFLHDTPSKSLFNKPERAFSSGCIRVQYPLELAELLLDDKDQWSRAKIEAMLAQKKTRTVHLRAAFPVLLMYLTALTEPDGTSYFYTDIYERDARLLEELNADIVMEIPASDI